ncbi:hypothetical protein HOP50_04g31420 [Chloropicon primus]|uniref:RanBP2-type domain-containing protein n=1 Tax=Chloropicon primus TaxID=1764295 RepID=A0A5B8MMN3_9CHLO|nr:hypothetical protein A3770_04p31400 [Chloropicon primus]UPQ99833.1 hypothetical protein HOP50_04g31420 [Chloropicon primus]|eukprot:QDZ20622.1 hypothetical protein A3770_04p31400 [Chloropicon primus]
MDAVVLLRGDACIGEVKVVVEDKDGNNGSCASKEEWVKVIYAETGLGDDAPGKEASAKVVFRVPASGLSSGVQNLLAALSEVNEKVEADATGDQPAAAGVSLTIACVNRSQRDELVSCFGNDIMASMGGAAVVSASKASKRMVQSIRTIESGIKEALGSESSVQDDALQARMEDLLRVIEADTTGDYANRSSLCIGAASIATRLLQLLKGEMLKQGDAEDAKGAELMTAEDVSALVQKEFLADEFSDGFKRVLMVSEACRADGAAGVTAAEVIVVFVALMTILEAVLKIEKKTVEDFTKGIVLPDGVPQSIQGPKSSGGFDNQLQGISGVREGDWICSQCGDFQFARNFKCRRCGARKPGQSSYDSRMSQGDWECPECNDYQFARNTHCRRCGAPKPGDGGGMFGGGGGGRGGAEDHEHFGSRGGGRGGGFGSGGWGSGGGGRSGGGKPGDWECPECNDYQFARNTHCRRCGAPKPGESGGMFGGGGGGGGGGFGSGGWGSGGGGRSGGGKPGDWECPECNDYQFARNTHCRRCGAPKPGESGGMFGGGGGGRGGAGDHEHFGGGRQGGFSSGGWSSGGKPGDWECPNCGDYQFARNTHCRRCGCPR